MRASRLKVAQITELFGLYVAYGLVQVNLKTEDKSCGPFLAVENVF
jgi:hypothetical protein